MGLTYNTPSVETNLLGNLKFIQTDVDKKANKDKLKLELNFRLPWENSLFKDSSVIVSPVLLNTYETKIGPLKFLSKNTDADWEKLRALPRTKQLENLLGLEMNFTNLGFKFQTGPILVTDFNRATTKDAMDIGPGLNFFGKWPLFGPLELSSEINSYYLFPVAESSAKDKIALKVEGTAWLRVAHFYDFSVSIMDDFFFASLQHKSKDIAISNIIGLTVCYGRLFRIFG